MAHKIGNIFTKAKVITYLADFYRFSVSLVHSIGTLRHQVFCLRHLVEFKIDVCMFTDGIREKCYFPILSKKSLDSPSDPILHIDLLL